MKGEPMEMLAIFHLLAVFSHHFARGIYAVHTHMTNTRLTDAKIIKHPCPVRALEFAIRRG